MNGKTWLLRAGALGMLCTSWVTLAQPEVTTGVQAAVPVRDLYADTWVATDALGRKVPVNDQSDSSMPVQNNENRSQRQDAESEQVGPPRPDKWVGIFYWTWHIPRRGGPNDVTKIIGETPPGTPIDWPNNDAPYHWGEPELGYYLMTDPFVIRKHASMLADAGVDAIFFDTTNPPATWKDQYEALCQEYEAMRQEGNATPRIAFICPFGGDVASVFNQLWNDLYKPGRWRELWFTWEGKPLILADPNVTDDPEIRNFFTFRKPMPDYWKGPSGPNQWSWLEVYPQHVFRDASGNPEQMSVGVAQNALPGTPGPAPMSHRRGAMGRSWHNGTKDSRPDAVLWGFNFEEQWRRALEVDPTFVFVTGWNEWIAGRYQEWNGYHAEECYYPGGLFVDEYTQEYSRDCEPMRGGHTDNYYYQLASWIRRFKGARPLPRSNGPHTITVDGSFEDWVAVTPEYRDTIGDIIHRNHPGYGSLTYRDETGRNDIINCKSTYDDENVYFYAETSNNISPPTDSHWMLLLLDTDQQADTGWLGYDYVINDEILGVTETTVKKWENNAWQTVGTARMALGERSLELAIPRKRIGMDRGAPCFDFHWADNIPGYGDVSVLGVHGDSAPNRRWNYRLLPKE